MRSRKEQQLKRELQLAGASAAEISELAAIASNLQRLDARERSAVRLRKTWIWKALTGGAIGLAMGGLLVVAAQPVLPTSWLYPVQKLSDNAAISLHPTYRAAVMMKRAQQVNTMVSKHADSGKVLATLADYTNLAYAYKATPNTNYAAFEYCKLNLQQAVGGASPQVRRAIQADLHSLEMI